MIKGTRLLTAALCVVTIGIPAFSAAADAGNAGAETGARGRYLIRIGGCNTCHTAGYSESGGKTPEKEWLTGERVGWRGSWGTTYAANLRLAFQEDSEDYFLKAAHGEEFRPPMPWTSLRAMTDEDLKALYQYVRSLGPAGEKEPDFVPPGQEPKTPFVLMTPQQPK